MESNEIQSSRTIVDSATGEVFINYGTQEKPKTVLLPSIWRLIADVASTNFSNAVKRNDYTALARMSAHKVPMTVARNNWFKPKALREAGANS